MPASTPAETGDDAKFNTVPPTPVGAFVVIITEVVGGVIVTGTVGGAMPNL
jgi:hypothetical protein